MKDSNGENSNLRELTVFTRFQHHTSMEMKRLFSEGFTYLHSRTYHTYFDSNSWHKLFSVEENIFRTVN